MGGYTLETLFYVAMRTNVLLISLVCDDVQTIFVFTGGGGGIGRWVVKTLSTLYKSG